MSDQTPWEILAAPFPFEDIDILPKNVKPDKKGALAIAYIDARAAQQRLDEAFGHAGWSFEVRECHVGGKGGIIGRLTVQVNGVAVVREDACELTNIESLKGGVSGAFKRCFSALGNRTLYEIDLGWFDCEIYNNKFSWWTEAAHHKMETKYKQQVNLPLSRREPRMMPEDLSEEAYNPGVKESINAQSPARSAFGYTPKQWPTEANFKAPATIEKVKHLAMVAKEKHVPDDERRLASWGVLAAYKLAKAEDRSTKEMTLGQINLVIDFFQKANPSQLTKLSTAVASVKINAPLEVAS